MNAWIVKHTVRANHVVFNVVERRFFAKEFEKLDAPRFSKRRSELANGFHIRIFGENKFNRKRVVGIHQKRQLLWLRP